MCPVSPFATPGPVPVGLGLPHHPWAKMVFACYEDNTNCLVPKTSFRDQPDGGCTYSPEERLYYSFTRVASDPSKAK